MSISGSIEDISVGIDAMPINFLFISIFVFTITITISVYSKLLNSYKNKGLRHLIDEIKTNDNIHYLIFLIILFVYSLFILANISTKIHERTIVSGNIAHSLLLEMIIPVTGFISLFLIKYGYKIYFIMSTYKNLKLSTEKLILLKDDFQTVVKNSELIDLQIKNNENFMVKYAMINSDLNSLNQRLYSQKILFNKIINDYTKEHYNY